MNPNSSWMKKYNLVKAYYEHYGNLEITARFKTKDGINYDMNGINIGGFISGMRTAYRNGKLSLEKIELLKAIGMRFECNYFEELWINMYNLAKKYFDEYNHLNVLASFRTKDGVTYDENGERLGVWLVTQRLNYKKGILEKDRVKLLNDINMDFEGKSYDFGGVKHYELAKAYYEHYGDLEVPVDFKTKNGYDYDENGINLGFWISNQRKIYNENRLPQERYELLKAIGMRFTFDKSEQIWNSKYKLAKAYYKRYGNLDVPNEFKTKNGYKYDKNGVNLRRWLNEQKKLNTKNRLSEKRRILLEKIGMDFSLRDFYQQWLEIYKLAKVYYEYYGNLEVKRTFKTNDGCTYDEDGLNLGKWIATQRCQYSKGILSQDKVDMLNSIGMVWDMNKKKDLIESWCIENSVDYDENKLILERISYQELVSKTRYLLSINEDVLDSLGKLHKIYSMSSVNMQSIYNCSLEELISKYYVMDMRKKLKKDNK